MRGARDTTRTPDADRDPAAARRPSSAAPARAVTGILALQRSAGNAAVTRVLHSPGGPAAAPPGAFIGPPAPPLAAAKSLADLDALTLSEFDSYATAQADWSLDRALPPPAKRQLMTLLEWARGHGEVLTGCGRMTVAALRATGLSTATRRDLRLYSQGAEGQADTVRLPAVSDVGKALAWGGALSKLYRTPGPATAAKAIKQDGEGADNSTGQLEVLASSGFVVPFTRYVARARPYLESPADVRAYLEMRTADGKDPASYLGRVPAVRNLHRFEAALLDAAGANRADRTRRRPLALVLHTAHDHNGAFMRDPNLTAVFTRATHLTLLIEGATTLSGVAGQIPVLARGYGQGRRISEVMVAGHGGPRSMELAGVPGTAGAAGQGLDLVGNSVATDRFFRTLLANMADSPDARIVLNACLTASNAVEGPLDTADPAAAAAQITTAIAAAPSLTTHVQRLAAARGLRTTVLGASGSFSSEATLLDAGGGMNIVSMQDPALTDPDKFAYVQRGFDPEGALRAVLECWAKDRPRTLAAVTARVAALGGATEHNLVVIRELYRVAQAHPTDADTVNGLAGAATPLDQLQSEDEAEPGHWAGMDVLATRVPAPHLATLLPPVMASASASNAYARLVGTAAWAKRSAARVPDFVDEVGRQSCRALDRYVPDAQLSGTLEVPGLLTGGGSAAGRLRLAIVTVKRNGRARAEATAHLQAVLGPASAFPPASGVSAAVAGYWNEPALLVAIGRGPAAAAAAAAAAPTGGAPAPRPNVDLDGDGTNDFHIVSETRRAVVTAHRLNLRERPDTASAVAATVGAGERLDVVGSSGEWKAVEFAGRLRFAHSSWLRLANPL